MITQVTYARTYNLGNYESLRLEAVATCDADPEAAYAEARAAVEAEYARLNEARQTPAQPAEYIPPPPPPASDAQRRFIASLQDKIGWNSEQLSVYADEQGVDLVAITKAQASTFIDGLQRLTKANSKPGIVEERDLPF